MTNYERWIAEILAERRLAKARAELIALVIKFQKRSADRA